jgi:hypothetical protein
MWSGPRNISTALMRSWGSRSDTFVCDEPFYAYYLLETGIDHPGRDEILAAHETDWRKVAAWLTGEIPEGKSIFYQKHMAHHMLPGIDRGWLNRVTHAFLIRDPGEMLASLVKVTPRIQIEDTGLPQQWELFELVRASTGETPAVLDARDVLQDPRDLLERLCSRVGVPFDDAMLEWEAGPRRTDGVWARHWYDAVERSTGFEAYTPKSERLTESLKPVHEACRIYYDRLYAHRLAA